MIANAYSKLKFLFNSPKVFTNKYYKSKLRVNYFSDNTNTVLNKKNKEKFSLEETEKYIKSYLEEDHRDMNKLPEEFHKYEDILIRVQNPVEPDDYECCGKGCTPCVWTIYDEKVQMLEEMIHDIYEHVNSTE